jgi:hypothetical protein
MGPIDCPESSVWNYHYWLLNNPEEHSSHILRCGSQKSGTILRFSLLQVDLLRPGLTISDTM